MGSLCSNDSDSCENITSKVCFSSLLQLHFIALIPSCSNSFRQFKIVDEFFSRGLNSKGLYQTSGKKKKQKVVVLCSPCPHQNVKLGIKSSVVQRRLRNVSKSVMHV